MSKDWIGNGKSTYSTRSISSSAVCYAWMRFSKSDKDKKATIEWFN